MDKLLQHYEKSSLHKFGTTTPDVADKKRRHLVVVPSSPKQFMVEKIPYFPYRPATDLRYLTGHTEPNSALVVDIDPQVNLTGNVSIEAHYYAAAHLNRDRIESKLSVLYAL